MLDDEGYCMECGGHRDSCSCLDDDYEGPFPGDDRPDGPDDDGGHEPGDDYRTTRGADDA